MTTTPQIDVDKLLRYTHLEKLYGHFPGVPGALPAVLGMSAEEYGDARRAFDVQAADAAGRLLAEPGVRDQVAALPMRPGDTVLAVGDSITDDLMSWAEILRHLLDRVRPDDRITVLNGGLSAHTTGMVMRRWPATLTATSPEWIVCALGGNDVARVGPGDAKIQVSLPESIANLRELRRVAGALSSASWTWMTPVPVLPDRIRDFPGFRFGQTSWDNADVVALARAMAEAFDDPVVDLVTVFGVPADESLQGPDGVHPSLAGQCAILTALLGTLTRLPTDLSGVQVPRRGRLQEPVVRVGRHREQPTQRPDELQQ